MQLNGCMMTKQPDVEMEDLRVEREIVVRAGVERVFAALTDPALFPTWGPERIEGKLAVGERPVFDFGGGGKCAVYVVALEAPRYFAYRWVQGETDPAILLGDPLAVPNNTLVEFHLDKVEQGTRVRVVESGKAPVGLVPKQALDQMGKGWELMLAGLPRHFAAETMAVSDRIENQIVLQAPRDKVFAALSDPTGWWAQKVEGTLAAGEQVLLDFGQFGKVVIHVEAVRAPAHLAYRWIPGGDDPARRMEDPRKHPSTLVEFHLDEVPEGTRVRQSESGFLSLPGGAGPPFKRAHQAWGVILGLLEHRFEAAG
jgi:uncharacterized protein YndB with AHSA1/START domain